MFRSIVRVRPFLHATRLFLISIAIFPSGAVQGESIRLFVDLTEAPRNIYHAKLTLPAKPGPMTLVYPKWIPGNHRPSGPIANLTGLRMEAGGLTLPWQRDPVDMYAFHVEVPAGLREIVVSFDDLTNAGSAGASGASASSNLLDLNWNQVVLYPQGMSSDGVEVIPSVRLPAGWKFGSALGMNRKSDGVVEFNPVSLTELVDSPLIAGSHYRQIQLTSAGENPLHLMDLVGDSDPDLEMTQQDLESYKKLVAETGLLFGARHYRQYHFLYTFSDQVGHHGLEHHESSDNSVAERTLNDPSLHLLEAGLLPHEFVHSWNGKYRRPAGLATRNYQEPMIGDLLWVYEGLTEYLGDVLTARSGLWSPEQYREALAETAAMLDHRVGRTWRPLEDTARSVQILRMAGPEWESWRRSLDYYPEGELIWLEVDTIIRQQTHGQRSLDDFSRRFHGGQSGPPQVVPYTFDDIVHTLNDVTPYNWAALLRERVTSTSAHAPLGGIERGGWRLIYNDKPNAFVQSREKLSDIVDLTYSLGLLVGKNGEFVDVIPGSPAYLAGAGPGMKLVAVNGRGWSKQGVREALRASQNSQQSLELLVEDAQFFRTFAIPYHGGEQNPHLERVAGQDDLLGKILESRAGPSAAKP